MVIDLRCPTVGGEEGKGTRTMEDASKRGIDLLSQACEVAAGPAGSQLGARAFCEALGCSYDGMLAAKCMADAFGHAVDDVEAEDASLSEEARALGVHYDNYDVAGLRTLHTRMAENAERYPGSAADVVSAIGGDRGAAVGKGVLDAVAEVVQAVVRKRDAAVSAIAAARAEACPTPGARDEETRAQATVVSRAGDVERDQVDEQGERGRGGVVEIGPARGAETEAAPSAQAPRPRDMLGNPLSIDDDIVSDGFRTKVELVGRTRVAFVGRNGATCLAEGASVRKVMRDTPEVVDADARLAVADYAAQRGVEASEYAVRRDLMDRFAALRAGALV